MWASYEGQIKHTSRHVWASSTQRTNQCNASAFPYVHKYSYIFILRVREWKKGLSLNKCHKGRISNFIYLSLHRIEESYLSNRRSVIVQFWSIKRCLNDDVWSGPSTRWDKARRVTGLYILSSKNFWIDRMRVYRRIALFMSHSQLPSVYTSSQI